VHNAAVTQHGDRSATTFRPVQASTERGKLAVVATAVAAFAYYLVLGDQYAEDSAAAREGASLRGAGSG
jgi:hypothetical protein